MVELSVTWITMGNSQHSQLVCLKIWNLMAHQQAMLIDALLWRAAHGLISICPGSPFLVAKVKNEVSIICPRSIVLYPDIWTVEDYYQVRTFQVYPWLLWNTSLDVRISAAWYKSMSLYQPGADCPWNRETSKAILLDLLPRHLICHASEFVCMVAELYGSRDQALPFSCLLTHKVDVIQNRGSALSDTWKCVIIACRHSSTKLLRCKFMCRLQAWQWTCCGIPSKRVTLIVWYKLLQHATLLPNCGSFWSFMLLRQSNSGLSM